MYTENRKQRKDSAKKRTFFFTHHTISGLKCKGRLSKKRRKKNDADRGEELESNPKNQIKEVNFGKRGKKL